VQVEHFVSKEAKIEATKRLQQNPKTNKLNREFCWFNVKSDMNGKQKKKKIECNIADARLPLSSSQDIQTIIPLITSTVG